MVRAEGNIRNEPYAREHILFSAKRQSEVASDIFRLNSTGSQLRTP